MRERVSRKEIVQVFLDAGFKELDALKIADAIKDQYMENVATKVDIEKVRNEIKDLEIRFLKSLDSVKDSVNNRMTFFTAFLTFVMVVLRFYH